MNQHMTTLRDYQNSALKQTYASMRLHRKTILQLPTGSGKSHIAAALMEHALQNNKRVAFLVDRIVLGDQITDRLFEAGLPISVMQAQHPMYNPNKPIQICSIQTLARRDRRYWPEVDLFIFDEAHMKYAIVQEIMDKWDLIPWLGLTATPFTRGLGLIWENLVVGITTKELIEQGFLCDYEAFGPDTPNLVGVRRSGGDYSAPDLETRMNSITGNIVKHYLETGNDRKGLAFTPTVAYSQYLAEEFKKNGVDADYVSHHDTPEQRHDKMTRYRSGDIRMMCNCDVLTKGFDMGDIEYGILARPTRSLALHIQMIGRFLRTHDNKPIATIMDHAGNIERLGFPDDDLPTTLDMGEPGENSDTRDEPEERQPRTCPQCYSIVPPATPQCPVCGHMARRQPEVEVKSGILKKLENPNITAGQMKQDVYGQLLTIAKTYSYSRGWVSHKYKEIFKVWPRGMNETPTEPTQDILGWVKSQNIRYAKRRTG
jgi:DNA repair protein RadD